MEVSTRAQRKKKWNLYRRNSFTNEYGHFSTDYTEPSFAHCCSVGEILRQDKDAFVPVYASARTSSECYGHETRVNSANILCKCRANRASHATGKELAVRGKRRKVKRSKSVVGQRQGMLTRSTSCGDVCYRRYNDSGQDSSSGTDNEQSEVFGANFDYTGQCDKCMRSCRGSLPNLNSINGDTPAQSQLGLEVMLSLINGPMQSVIDSKDDKIRGLERTVEELEGDNRRMKNEEQPADAARILALERNVENCSRQIEQLEEANKTANETIRFLEDLRKNDSKYVDILKSQINDLEVKLSKSDEVVREADKDWKTQSERLKAEQEKRVQELQKSLRSKESRLRDYEKVKMQVAKQKEELEEKRNNESKLHGKMCQQVLELQREIQLRETKVALLEKEKSALTESLSQSENLQRQDQRSSYVLQMKIVELQEKLEASYRKNEALLAQHREWDSKQRVVGKQPQGKWDCLDESTNGSRANSVSEVESHSNKGDKRWQVDEKSEQKCDSVFDIDVNDVLREKVTELKNNFYSKGEINYNGDHIENLALPKESFNNKKWLNSKQDRNTQSGNMLNKVQSISDISTSSKKELAFTGDKRRPSSDDCSSSSTSSSASSSRRTSFESPRMERRQLKVLKVRKVSKENISQFQQTSAYTTSRQQARLKDVREDPCGSSETIKSNHKHLNLSLRTTKDRSTCNI